MLLVLKRRMLCVFWGVWGSCTCHIRFRIVAVSFIFLCMHTSLFYGSWIIHGLLSHSHLPVCQQGFQRWEQSPVSLAVQTVQHRDSCLQEQCTHGDRACTSVLMEVTSWSATGTGTEPGIGLLFTQVILLKKCIETESQLQSQTMKFVGTMISYRLVSTCPKTVSCHSDCFFVRWNLILLLWYEHALEHETICQHAHDIQRQPSAVAPITLAQVHMLPIETPDGQEYFAISLCPPEKSKEREYWLLCPTFFSDSGHRHGQRCPLGLHRGVKCLTKKAVGLHLSMLEFRAKALAVPEQKVFILYLWIGMLHILAGNSFIKKKGTTSK